MEKETALNQAAIARPSTKQLPRWLLTLSLIVVTIIPVSIAFSVWYFVPNTPEPELPVVVEYRSVSWPPGERDDAQFVPAMTLKNPSNDTWENISVSINRQFYFYYPESLPGNSSCDIPLFLFRTSGNQGFRPRSQEVKRLIVYAQLPSGGRAIYDSARRNNNPVPNEQGDSGEAISPSR